jgi:hypothetical protein
MHQIYIYLYTLCWTPHTHKICITWTDFLGTRNFWVSGLYPSSSVWRSTTFWKLDLFPSSGLRLALSKGSNWVGVFFPLFTWGRKHIQFPQRCAPSNTRQWVKSRNPEIPCVMHHCHNPSKTSWVFWISDNLSLRNNRFRNNSNFLINFTSDSTCL